MRVVVKDVAGFVRCDKWLGQLWPEVSRARWQRALAAGRVTRAGRPLRATDRLSPGDELEVPPLQEWTEQAAPPEPRAEDVALPVLFEDEHMVVLDKPEGMVVHPGAGVETGTLVSALLHRYGDLPDLGSPERRGIVHRLDKGTSGLMVVARTAVAGRALQHQFAARETRKEYLAVVAGELRPPTGTVNRPIGRHPVARMKMTCREDGRPALTRWEVTGGRPGWTVSRVLIETGRTHQIRVHLASLGHPVIGDTLYGFRPGKLPPEAPPVSRILLHAHRLSLAHPVSGEAMSFSSDPPAEFLPWLDSL